MGYRVYSFGRKDHRAEAMEFEDAAKMVEEGLECMRALADEMEDKYSERMYGSRRGFYGMRDDYGRRGGYGEREMWDEPMMHERRRRDSMGRYM